MASNSEAWKMVVRHVITNSVKTAEETTDCEREAILRFIQLEGSLSPAEAAQYYDKEYEVLKSSRTDRKYPLWLIFCLCIGVIESLAAIISLITSGPDILFFLAVATAFGFLYVSMKYIRESRQDPIALQIWNSAKKNGDSNEMLAGLMKIKMNLSEDKQGESQEEIE